MSNGGVFYNGRQIVTPTVVSAVVDAALVNPNPNFGNKLVLMGSAIDGQPNTELVFTDYEQARRALYGGDLLDACRAAFAPSDDAGMYPPSQISCIRVDPATQAVLTLKDNSGNSTIDGTIKMWGSIGNQVTGSVATGTKRGKLVTIKSPTGSVYSADNLYNALFSVSYTGALASAVINVNATGNQVTLEAPIATVVGTFDLNVYDTVKKLVDAINSDFVTVVGFSANVLGGNNTTPTKNGIDKVTSQDVKTAPYTVTGTLVAIVNWLNTVPIFSAVVHSGTMTVPVNVTNKVANGAVNGNITNTQWSNAFTLLQGISCGFIAPLTYDPAIITMADSHVQYMSTVAGNERRCFAGMQLATTDDAAITQAALINSDRTALVHLGYYDYRTRGGGYGDQGGGNGGALVLYQPYILAALIAGAFAGCSPGTPLTNKSLKVRGLERTLNRPGDTDPLIIGGVMCVAPHGDGTFRVVESVSTWLNDNNYYRVEISTGVALDTLMKGWRLAVRPVVGKKNGPHALGEAVSRSETYLKAAGVPEPNGPQLIVGDSANPPYRKLTATAAGDVIQVQAEVSPAIPVNYILVTVYAQPFSGTLSATP